MLVNDGELAGQIRFDEQIFVVRFDAGRHTDDVRNRRRRRNCHAVGIAHAVHLDARFERIPIHRDRLIDLDITTTLLGQQFQRVIGQDATIPQRAFVRAVTTALLSKLRRSKVGVIAHRFH